MALPVEHWDLYDSQHRYIGVIRRGMKIPDGYYHVAVEVIPTDMRGHMLITRRSFEKKRGPGKYEFPAGSVIAGEKPTDAAVRELREETGLVPESLLPLQKKTVGSLQRLIYIAVIPDLLTQEITLQEHETIDYKIVTMDEWLDMKQYGYMENDRIRLYSAEMLEFLAKNIGKAEDVADSAPRNTGATGVHRVDIREAMGNHHRSDRKLAAGR